MEKNKIIFQIVWGIVLTAAGIGVFFRMPQVMPKIENIAQYAYIAPFIRFCFYFIGVMLIGGGIKKIHKYYKLLKELV